MSAARERLQALPFIARAPEAPSPVESALSGRSRSIQSVAVSVAAVPLCEINS